MPSSDYMPTVDDVGAILRTRTKDTSGTELGTFTEDTRPTEGNVTTLIERATDLASAALGTELPAAAWPAARTFVALRAAMLVELGFFPEQVAAGRSPFNQLRDELKEQLLLVQQAAAVAQGDEIGGVGAGDMPRYAGMPATATDWDSLKW